MHEKLKIKIASLTAEARIIRNYEKRSKAHARRLADKLAADSIRRERAATALAAVESSRGTVNELRAHRAHVVRIESRYAYLTLTFLRGKAYHRVERQGSKRVNLDKLVAMINRFAGYQVSSAKVDDWLMGRPTEMAAAAAE